MKYKRNHYVPESYLESFAVVHPGDRNPMLWVYDKDGTKPPHKQSPKDTAVINDLYTISHGTLPPHALEQAFGKQESKVSPILARWRERGAVPQTKEICEVAYFVALLHLRNPKAAKWFEAMSETIQVEKVKSIARSDAQFDLFWERLTESTSSRPFTKKQFREKLLDFDEHFIVKIDPKYTTFAPLAHAGVIYDQLIKMNWCLCTTPDGVHFFTSDSPVVVIFKKGNGVGFGGGFGHPTAEVTFPISPNVCIVLTRHSKYKTFSVNSEFAKKANRKTAFNAERYVFADELKTGIENLVKKLSFTRQLPRLDKDEIIAEMRAKPHPLQRNQYS